MLLQYQLLTYWYFKFIIHFGISKLNTFKIYPQMMCEKLTLEFTEFVQRHPHENKVVQKFMNRCAKVTWQMVIQHPPMWLSVDDHEFDDEKHKLWWSCDQAAANRIDFFVWPALYDYKRGNLLMKGCVFAS